MVFEGIVQPEQVLPTAHRVRAEKKEEVFPWLPLQTRKYFLIIDHYPFSGFLLISSILLLGKFFERSAKSNLKKQPP